MKNVRKVLVALAFSEYARSTFEFAADFANCSGAELIVANVINARDVESVRTISAMGYDVDGEHYVQNIKAERARILEDIIADSDMPPERIRTIFVVGNPMEALLNLIVEEAVEAARGIGYPLVVRPSYVLGGRAMSIVYDDD